METMEWPVAKPIFRTSTANHHLHGERSDRKREATSFEFFASLFADDCAVLFESHKDMVIGMDYMYQHFLKFGLEIHLGRGTAKSKTEAMFFPKPRCDDGTTPPNFPCADGFISYTRLFKYLGSHIVPGLDSAEEIKIRIQKASQAFGCLSKSTFRNKGRQQIPQRTNLRCAHPVDSSTRLRDVVPARGGVPSAAALS